MLVPVPAAGFAVFGGLSLDVMWLCFLCSWSSHVYIGYTTIAASCASVWQLDVWNIEEGGRFHAGISFM